MQALLEMDNSIDRKSKYNERSSHLCLVELHIYQKEEYNYTIVENRSVKLRNHIKIDVHISCGLSLFMVRQGCSCLNIYTSSFSF